MRQSLAIQIVVFGELRFWHRTAMVLDQSHVLLISARNLYPDEAG
jgi:hypothetical protein